MSVFFCSPTSPLQGVKVLKGIFWISMIPIDITNVELEIPRSITSCMTVNDSTIGNEL